jgi:hypothetical protein
LNYCFITNCAELIRELKALVMNFELDRTRQFDEGFSDSRTVEFTDARQFAVASRI